MKIKHIKATFLLALGLLLLTPQGLAIIISGRVSVANDKGVANVAVSDGTDVVVTDKNGVYKIDAEDSANFIFIAVPEGHRCEGKFYKKLPTVLKDGHTINFNLLNDPRSRDRKFLFITFTDTHLSKEAHIAPMISRVAAPINRLKPAPRFVVETGDNVVSRGKEEFAAHKAFTAALEIPYYNMPGNHDTYDDTMPWRNYEEVYGQPYYAWQYGPYTFVCLAWTWNGNLDKQLVWLEKILDATARDRYVIFFSHSWDFFIQVGKLERVLAILNKYDVKAAFEGHWHMMRTYRIGGIPVFLSTADRDNLRDLCPAGFRIVELSGDGKVSSTWRSSGIEKQIIVVSPQKENRSGKTEVVVNTFDSGAVVEEVSLLLEKKGTPPETLKLSRTGQLTWTGAWHAKAGEYSMTAIVKDNLGREWKKTDAIAVLKNTRPSPRPETDWPHFRGNPSRTGVTDSVVAPPLYLSWAHTTGQMFGINSPAISGGRLYIGTEDDLNIGTPDAGLLCLDAVDGKKLWSSPVTDRSIRSTPSVAGGIVAAQTDDGQTLIYDANSGSLKQQIKTLDYTMLMFNSSPLLLEEELYSGNGAFFAKYPLSAKAPSWSIKRRSRRMKGFIQPSPAVSDEYVVLGWEGFVVLNRNDGSIVWEARKTLDTPGEAIKFREVCSTPVIHGDLVVWTTTKQAHVIVSKLKTGKTVWSKSLNAWNGFSSPAVTSNSVFIVAEADILSLDLKTGNELWRTPIGDRAFSSPTVSGDHLYFGDEAGILHCLNTKDGSVEWRQEIGAPIQGSPTISGNSLYITARDGTIYCFTSAKK